MGKKSDKKQEDIELLRRNREEIARALEILFTRDFISRKQLYYENFMRGIFFSIGGIIGATIVIALLIWLLSLFGEVPFIGPLLDKTKDTLEQGSSIVHSIITGS